MGMDIDYVARLARLKLSDSEKKQFGKQLKDILGYMDKLNNLNTEGIEPTAHSIPIKNVWRDDSISGPIDYKLLERIMVEKHERFFKVPPVL